MCVFGAKDNTARKESEEHEEGEVGGNRCTAVDFDVDIGAMQQMPPSQPGR